MTRLLVRAAAVLFPATGLHRKPEPQPPRPHAADVPINTTTGDQ